MTSASVEKPAAPRLLSPPPQAVVDRVLFLSDLTAHSDLALEHARFLAESLGARLDLYHVVGTRHAHGTHAQGPGREALRREVLRAREHLERHALEGRGRGQIVVDEEPDVAVAIASHVAWAHPDLVVMSVRAQERFSPILAGSTTGRLLRRGMRPILCIREPEHGVALPYRRILVPTDLSEASRGAFPLAALLARRFGAEIVALHAETVEAPPALVGTAHAVESSPSEKDVLAFVADAFRGFRVLPRIALGSAWTAIVETARTEHADAIVLSSHGQDSLEDRLMGSHAERVVRHAPCPVLVVPGARA